MKKIIALSICLLAFTANSFAIKVHAYFVGVVQPGCFEVLVVVTNDDGQVLGSGNVYVGSTCTKNNITTAPGSPNDLGELIVRYPEIMRTAEDSIRNNPPK